MAVPNSMLSSRLTVAPDPAGGRLLDAWVKEAILGVEILTVEARTVLAGVETYLKDAEAAGLRAEAA